jgi:mannose-6-phosphate isomerase-like protein (cupin superfamily)
LHIDQGKEFSMHYHIEKRETWYLAKGKLTLVSIDPDTAEPLDCTIYPGQVVEVYRGIPHKLYAIEESDIFEASTPDKPEDSYRVWKGDSQK